MNTHIHVKSTSKEQILRYIRNQSTINRVKIFKNEYKSHLVFLEGACDRGEGNR